MRKPKVRNTPSVTVFGARPENLKREISTNAQKNYSDGTIIYGDDDALPLRIAQAVDDSPATSSCLETHAQFIKGAGFTNPELQKIKVDDSGTTLWDLHCKLSDIIPLFWGFAVNFKYNKAGKILQTFDMSFESCRFKKPEGDSPFITEIVYNPYFGTIEYRKEFSKTYPVWDGKPDNLAMQIATLKKDFPGQIYYYGRTGPLSRFYPKPKYWSGRKWIYIDGKIQEAHAENMDNGWFQSVLMNVIGDPSEMSKNPRYQEEYEDSSGNKRKRSTKTVGEEFNEQMGATFSGSKKMGTVQVHWSKNYDTATKIQPFPANTNADLFLALQDLTTKNITIATRTPSILANISEGVSLGSAGSEIQKAIELMQANTLPWRQVLENFYNEVLFPNMAEPPKDRVSIINYNPVSVPIEVDEKFWQVLSDKEKRDFVKKTYPSIMMDDLPAKTSRTLIEVIGVGGTQALMNILTSYSSGQLTEPQASNIMQILFGISPEEATRMLQKQAVELDAAGQPIPVDPPPAGNEALKGINLQQLSRIQAIVKRYNIGQVEPDNAKALTFEQAKQFLLSYGLTEEQMNAWLVTPDES